MHGLEYMQQMWGLGRMTRAGGGSLRCMTRAGRGVSSVQPGQEGASQACTHQAGFSGQHTCSGCGMTVLPTGCGTCSALPGPARLTGLRTNFLAQTSSQRTHGTGRTIDQHACRYQHLCISRWTSGGALWTACALHHTLCTVHVSGIVHLVSTRVPLLWRCSFSLLHRACICILHLLRLSVSVQLE